MHLAWMLAFFYLFTKQKIPLDRVLADPGVGDEMTTGELGRAGVLDYGSRRAIEPTFPILKAAASLEDLQLEHTDCLERFDTDPWH